MIALSNSCRYFVYQDVCNMRMSFNGPGGLVNNQMDANPLSGDIFIFINRRKNQCKLLRYCENGFELYHKRLTQGTFEVPTSGEIEAFQLQSILCGIVVEKYRKKVVIILKKWDDYLYVQYIGCIFAMNEQRPHHTSTTKGNRTHEGLF